MEKVLIANRGEIALRVLRTCREMGIATVAPYASIDRDLLHLRYADDIICVSKDDYLCAESLVAAAKIAGCDGIHPGYGFLAEQAEFCQLVEQNGMAFIGPTSEQILTMGNKVSARAVFSDLGLKSVPGSEQSVADLGEASDIAGAVGFPVMVKAAFGGGGRGIRIVDDARSLAGAFEEAGSEAAAAFGDGTVYVEKYLDNARHVEVQIVGDGNGNAIHLGTRECSIQRHNQKVIEEAPAPYLDPSLVAELCARSARAAAQLNYRNAGTLEYLFQDGEFYFVEMNTRIQVEHPVSEVITGVDLVRLQIETASSGALPMTQADIAFRGCAVECRLNAEDDQHVPSPGVVSHVGFPAGPGVRVDSHLYDGYRIPHQFDSLIAKLVAHDSDRSHTLDKMHRMLGELEVEGIATNLTNLLRIIDSEGFRQGPINTRYLDQLLE